MKRLSSSFIYRHIGVRDDVTKMLVSLKQSSLENFINKVVPHEIRDETALKRAPLPKGGIEEDIALLRLREIMDQNIRAKNFLGQGFYGTVTPHVIQRNMLESAGWYTPYTPYQSEISQGRLEMLLNFQTMVNDLTGMHYSNASLLDEGSAAAEAMTLTYDCSRGAANKFFIANDVHPTTIAVVKNRALPLEYVRIFNFYFFLKTCF